jgi:MoaA/NifB/PqqE/SkfB family radical SAM enzyme
MNVRPFPKRVTIELTNECNLTCPQCPRRYMKSEIGEMSSSLWRKIINEIKQYDILAVPFWRGESFMHSHFRKNMEELLDVCDVGIATNGTVNPYVAIDFSRMNFVSVSYHTSKAKKFINRILDIKETNKGRSPSLQISTIEKEKTGEEAYRLYGDKADSFKIYKEHSNEGRFGSIKEGREGRTFCDRLLSEITIAYDGEVSRCCYNWNCDSPMNVREMSIKEAWTSDEYVKIRDEYPDKICLACDQWGLRTIAASRE